MVFVGHDATFSFSIRDRYTIRIFSRFRGFYNSFMFLFSFLMSRTTIFSMLRMLLDSFGMPLRI